MSITASRENVIRMVAQHSAAELELKVLDLGINPSGITEYVLTKVALIAPNPEEKDLLQLLLNEQLRRGLFVTRLEACYPMSSRVQFINLN